jgi:hypothetical protein
VRAADVENALVAQLSLVRPGSWGADGVWRSQPWSISISEVDASAWLAMRLPRWVKSRDGDAAWPPQVAQVRVAFTDDSIIAGALLGGRGGGGDGRGGGAGGGAGRGRVGGEVQVLGVEFHPSIDSTGALRARASRVHVGRLPMPASWLASTLTRRAAEFVPKETLASPPAQAISAALLKEDDRGGEPGTDSGGAVITRDAVIRLDDGRRVRVLGLTPRDGRLEVRFQTERRASSP